jgi:hypothetical protein
VVDDADEPVEVEIPDGIEDTLNHLSPEAYLSIAYVSNSDEDFSEPEMVSDPHLLAGSYSAPPVDDGEEIWEDEPTSTALHGKSCTH